MAVEPLLIQPTFVLDFPTDLAPLAKNKPNDTRFVEKFEAFANGMEIANAFSELNDPIEQRARFDEQVALQEKEGFCDAVDDDYISALEVGMPPAGGLEIGIDRVVMLLTGATSIREVILFPTLKPRTVEEVGQDEAEEDGEDAD